MKTYKSHKTVKAAKIVNIADTVLHLEGGGWFKVGSLFILKHKPHVGGYLVEYADGYRSFSPAKAFEEGYSEVVTH